MNVKSISSDNVQRTAGERGHDNKLIIIFEWKWQNDVSSLFSQKSHQLRINDQKYSNLRHETVYGDKAWIEYLLRLEWIF